MIQEWRDKIYIRFMLISMSRVMGFIGLLVMSFGGNALCQDLFPADGEVFRDDVVPVIRITIDPDSLQAIYDNPYSDHEYPAGFDFDNGFVNEQVSLVGFRCRGNTSRSSKKKSFKVAFNSFDGDQKFYGLEKMNLNGEHNVSKECRYHNSSYLTVCVICNGTD